VHIISIFFDIPDFLKVSLQNLNALEKLRKGSFLLSKFLLAGPVAKQGDGCANSMSGFVNLSHKNSRALWKQNFILNFSCHKSGDIGT
jgi:hypothetical protein